MSLDKLYQVVKNAKFPIRDREELIKAIGNEIILFERKYYDAEEIAVTITEYPLHHPSDVLRWFLHETEEAYNEEEAKNLGSFETMMEG